MGQTTDELAALRKEQSGEPATKAAQVREETIQNLEKSGIRGRAFGPGDSAPEFVLLDQASREVRLTDLLKKGPVVLNFYRGAWCPFCNIELRGLQRSYPRIRELGASLVAVSPQLPDGSMTLAEKHALEFPVLSDVGNVVAKTYGLVFRVPDDQLEVFQERGLSLEEVNGQQGAYELPVPATFIVGTEGLIRNAFVNVDHTDRTDPDEIVAILEQARLERYKSKQLHE